MLSGFPVVAALMCVEHHDQLVQSIDGFIDQVIVPFGRQALNKQ